MEENRKKQNVQKNVKEKIAISNLREEISMEKRKTKKIAYGVLASCAMFALCAGVMINKLPLEDRDSSIMQAKAEKDDLKNEKEVLKAEININERGKTENDRIITGTPLKKWDAQTRTGDIRFAIEAAVPNDFEDNYSVIGVYTKGEKSKQYDELQYYYVHYQNKEDTRNIALRFAFKEKVPLRDYFFLDVEKKSKIGEVELEITKYEESYLVIFSDKDVNYDIETKGITQDELVEFLTSLISNSKSYEQLIEKDQDTNVTEQIKDNSASTYPAYYAGKYVDAQGNNVILLKEDTKENRKAICKLLNITESKTKFEMAKYSYEYLTELQNKISEKMQKKELPFVIASSVMEDKNWIEIEVTTNKESELKKIKELDTIGGAFSIRYSENGASKTDLLEEKE